jgi:hypothetical protein
MDLRIFHALSRQNPRLPGAGCENFPTYHLPFDLPLLTRPTKVALRAGSVSDGRAKTVAYASGSYFCRRHSYLALGGVKNRNTEKEIVMAQNRGRGFAAMDPAAGLMYFPTGTFCRHLDFTICKLSVICAVQPFVLAMEGRRAFFCRAFA